MSEPNPVPEVPVPATPIAQEIPTPMLKQPAVVVAGIALLGVLGLGWLNWHTGDRLETTRQELARRLADADGAQREAQAHAKQSREALDALQAKVGALEARLAETQSQQLALDMMYQELSRARDDRLLAEIEQELALAAQQLQLAGNVQAALIALQGAENRLAKNAQPQFLSLRKLIVRDIERLKGLPGADVPGVALKLDAILDAVPMLPMAFEQRPAAAKPARPVKGPQTLPADKAAVAEPAAAASGFDWRGMTRAWFADLWHELRQLVRIERIDRPDPGLLAPRETYFLRENLRLRLLAARLALLARDNRSFQSDLGKATEWLERYFDLRAPAVAEARDALKQLARLDVMRTPGEINETLAAVRNFKLARERVERGAVR